MHILGVFCQPVYHLLSVMNSGVVWIGSGPTATTGYRSPIRLKRILHRFSRMMNPQVVEEKNFPVPDRGIRSEIDPKSGNRIDGCCEGLGRWIDRIIGSIECGNIGALIKRLNREKLESKLILWVFPGRYGCGDLIGSKPVK